jgi:hypothetical protein
MAHRCDSDFGIIRHNPLSNGRRRVLADSSYRGGKEDRT